MAGYRDASWELEAVLPQARHLGPVTVDRDAGGTGCKPAGEQWADITDDAGASRAADIASALLHGLAPADRMQATRCSRSSVGPAHRSGPGRRASPGR